MCAIYGVSYTGDGNYVQDFFAFPQSGTINSAVGDFLAEYYTIYANYIRWINKPTLYYKCWIYNMSKYWT